MKKRKIKLFASIASLALVVAVMGVGVWAATTQAVKVTSTVKFVATGIAADITLAVANGSGGEALVKSAKTGSTDWMATTAPTLTSFALNASAKTAEANSIAIAIEFTDANQDGVINTGSTFTYTFTISNTTAVESWYQITLGTQNDAIVASITTSDIDTSVQVKDTTQTPVTGKTNTDKKYGHLNATTNGSIVITYTVTAPTAYDSLTAEQKSAFATKYSVSSEFTSAVYYEELNYSTALNGYYTIADNTAIADITLDFSTKKTYIPANDIYTSSSND